MPKLSSYPAVPTLTGTKLAAVDASGDVGLVEPSLFPDKTVTPSAANAFATDNVVLRSDGVGRGMQASGVALDDSNRIGFGIATPTSQIHVVGSSNQSAQITLRLEGTSNIGGGSVALRHNNAAGALPGANDRVGAVQFGSEESGANRNGARFEAVAEGNYSTTSLPTFMRFLTASAGSASPVERLRVTADGHTLAGADNTYTLGDGSHRWSAIYAANGTIQTSDQRDKIIVGDLTFAGQMVDAIDPVLFKWIVGGNRIEPSESETVVDDEGNVVPKMETVSFPGVRTHAGFRAQDLKAAMDDIGQEFGAWGREDRQDPDSRQWTRPDQLIPVLWAALKATRAEVAELRALLVV